jgi:hypothetical protein
VEAATPLLEELAKELGHKLLFTTVRRRARNAVWDLVMAIEVNADIRKLAFNPSLLSIVASGTPLPRDDLIWYNIAVKPLDQESHNV